MFFKQNAHFMLALTILLCVIPSQSMAASDSAAEPVAGYDVLLARYGQIETLLQDNQYGVPLYIQSTFGDEYAQGDVYALVEHEFAAVLANLNSPGHWCDVVLQHINVKGCDVNHNAEHRDPDRDLTIYVGRNYFQTPDEAHEMNYKFVSKAVRDDYIQVDLTSKDGPLGTSDYQLIFEAIPFNDKASFIHFKYAYQYGFMARLALDGYLATLGRNKVGFSVKGYDENHEPLYVKGLQGIVERNSMRYFIAIRSFLDTASLGPQQWGSRIDHWYSLAKRFERQLIEVRDKAYLETKTREYNYRENNNENDNHYEPIESADLDELKRRS